MEARGLRLQLWMLSDAAERDDAGNRHPEASTCDLFACCIQREMPGAEACLARVGGPAERR